MDSSNLILILSIVGFLSFALLFVTSFIKIAIVFGLLRSAMGTPQLPPNSVITGLALILSFYIMYPVSKRIVHISTPYFQKFTDNNSTTDTKVESFKTMIYEGSKPLKQFMNKHSHEQEKILFADLSNKMQQNSQSKTPTNKTSKNDFIVLLPSFLLSEITEAFQIGFLLFLPFLIIDLLTANILMALGMHMLSPTTISLPFKLLLFVSVNGFTLLSQSLVISYI